MRRDHVALCIICLTVLNLSACVTVTAIAPPEGVIAEDARNLAVIDRSGSLRVYPDRTQEHRIYGYARPDTGATKLLTISSFTADVSGNPYGCSLGAYYSSDDMSGLDLKVNRFNGPWAEVIATQGNEAPVVIFILREWIRMRTD
jgi:hypothetical protein